MDRSVVRDLYPDRVKATTKKFSNNAPPGSAPYLAIYPQAITRVINKLTNQEYANLQTAVDEYNSVRPPDHVKAV